jgi:hypothetical protein
VSCEQFALESIGAGPAGQPSLLLHRQQLAPRALLAVCGEIMTDEEEAEKALEKISVESDEDLAFEFLGYKEVEKDGVRSLFYLTPGSKREAECRTALLRLLRGGGDLSGALRWRLAGLLDPKSNDDRTLVIEKRAKGGTNEPTTARAIEIARAMAAVVNAGGNRERAIEAAIQQFGISRSSAERAFKEHTNPWIIKPNKSAMN